MAFEIVTESTCNLKEDMIDEWGLNILPMTFMSDGKHYQSYLKGEHTNLQQFYSMMREGKVITTSLPNIVEAEETFRTILDAGKDVLYLGFSSALSSTYETIDLLLKDLSGQYPEQTIRSIETLGASGGQGLLVYLAAKKSKENDWGVNEAAQWVLDHRLNLAHWFTVDDLMFLFRGGRVSKTSAWAGTMLNIKPVMHVDNEGRLIPLEKVRGRKKSLNGLIDHLRQTALEPISEQTIIVNHGDCLSDAEYVADTIKKEFGISDIIINYIDPVIGAHSGPGTVALFFMADSR